MSELTNNDYKQILEYYNKPIPKSSQLLKNNAEQILSEKLCKCIKKIEPENEARSIGICTKTIFNRKGYTRGKFKCKGKRTVTVKKTIKNRN
jgi:L-amino acid N-acyltransferase YncA